MSNSNGVHGKSQGVDEEPQELMRKLTEVDSPDLSLEITELYPHRFPGGNKKGGWLASAISRFDGFINAVVSAGSIGLGKPSTAVGRNMAYRRAIWERAGGFGDSVGHASGVDDLLLQRFSKVDAKVAFANDPSTHVPALGSRTLGEWWQRKRRHLSVGASYKSEFILISTLLYLFNLGLIACLALAIAGQIAWWWLGIVWIVKLAADWLTLWEGRRWLQDTYNWTWAWLIGEVVSPLIFTMLVPLSLVGRVKWKARELER